MLTNSDPSSNTLISLQKEKRHGKEQKETTKREERKLLIFNKLKDTQMKNQQNFK